MIYIFYLGSDGSQAAGISVVRVGHEGRPDDATDSENEDEKVPHVTLSVDSYYNEPDSIIKYGKHIFGYLLLIIYYNLILSIVNCSKMDIKIYFFSVADSGAEMLQSLRIETRENSLVGFQNDHCYTPLTSPSQVLPQKNDTYASYDDPVIEITHTPPPKPVATPKKITILEQQIIPKGKKILINSTEPAIILKGNDVLTKPLPVLSKSKLIHGTDKVERAKSVDNTESSSASSSGDSIPDRDSDSDYKDTKEKSVPQKLRRLKSKPRILKNQQTSKITKVDPKFASKLKINKNLIKKDIKEKLLNKNPMLDKKQMDLDSMIPATKLQVVTTVVDQSKSTPKPVAKVIKKEKKTPAHVTALISDMTSLFSTPDVIRRVSTENKVPTKTDKEPVIPNKKQNETVKSLEPSDMKSVVSQPVVTPKSDNLIELKPMISQKTYSKQTKLSNVTDKSIKNYDPMPQLDDASLAQILQDTTPPTMKVQPSISSANVINSPGLPGPLSPTLDLLGGLQPEEDGLTEDLLLHVARLVESSENLQEVIDKQVLGKVDTVSAAKVPPLVYQAQPPNLYTPPQQKAAVKTVRKDPIEIVRRDGRVITLPPIEAPATRSSKRKTQVDSVNAVESIPVPPLVPIQPNVSTPEPTVQQVSKQYTNKKLARKQEHVQASAVEKMSVESQESWNSEDDPNR